MNGAVLTYPEVKAAVGTRSRSLTRFTSIAIVQVPRTLNLPLATASALDGQISIYYNLPCEDISAL